VNYEKRFYPIPHSDLFTDSTGVTLCLSESHNSGGYMNYWKNGLILILILSVVWCTSSADTMNSPSSQSGIHNQNQSNSVGNGFYEFRSNVEGADVFLNDQPVGNIKDGSLKIPVEIYEKPVTRELRVQAAGYSTYRETLVQSPKVGKTLIVRGTLQVLPLNLTGSLSLAVSPPGSAVTIDNTSVGVVDQSGIITIRTIDAGNRMIQVTMPGYKDHLEQIYVAPNLENKIRISLNPITTGTLDISSTPSGAEVTVNGSPYGVTPVTAADLEQGSYVIGCNLPGYQNAQSQVILSAGKRQPVSMTLQPIPTATPSPVPTTPQPTPTPTPEAGLTSVVVVVGLLGACLLFIKRR